MFNNFCAEGTCQAGFCGTWTALLQPGQRTALMRLTLAVSVEASGIFLLFASHVGKIRTMRPWLSRQSSFGNYTSVVGSETCSNCDACYNTTEQITPTLTCGAEPDQRGIWCDVGHYLRRRRTLRSGSGLLVAPVRVAWC
jgi:hypothetical protein